MQGFMRALGEFLKLEDGVTAMEYALLGGLIAVVIVAAVSNVGASVSGLFSYVANQVAIAVGGN
jgi:pilus assembly protein Flp/PilA